jgi:gliding motility-associated-like protein
MPLTTNNLGTWTGPGITGFVFDPATSGTGNLVLTYNTNSSPVGLCPDQATLSVNVFSLATPAITQIGPFCNMHGGSMIPVTPLGGIFSGATSQGVVNQAGLFTPAQAAIGANIVNYSVSAGPCVAFAQTTINVEAFVSADFHKYAGPFCKNDAPVNLNSIVQNPGGVWSGPGQINGLFTPANANIGNNNVIIYYTSSQTPSLCPDSSAIRIQVNDVPNVNVVSNLEKGCVPVEVTFNTPSANSGTGSWNFGDGSAVVNGLNTVHTFNTPGSYTVTFNYQDEIGCSTQAILPYAINVYPVPHANFSFSPDDISLVNPTVQFSNLSTILGNNTYQWQIADMYQLNDVNPKVTFQVAGEYMITLTATTPEGCKDQVSQVVSVKNDYGVYIPNSFTPNFDGVNDIFIPIFSPYGLDLKTYDLEIFDRWGISLFKTKDYTQGWNGFAKGTEDPLKQDVYVYKIRYKDAEGKIYNKTGHVSLLR